MLIFPNMPPLLLDGEKKIIRIVSNDSYYAKNADLVLNYENVHDFDM